jgi:hypothetical protein
MNAVLPWLCLPGLLRQMQHHLRWCSPNPVHAVAATVQPPHPPPHRTYALPAHSFRLRQARMGSVYSLDEHSTLRKSHENPQVKVGEGWKRRAGRNWCMQAAATLSVFWQHAAQASVLVPPAPQRLPCPVWVPPPVVAPDPSQCLPPATAASTRLTGPNTPHTHRCVCTCCCCCCCCCDALCLLLCPGAVQTLPGWPRGAPSP